MVKVAEGGGGGDFSSIDPTALRGAAKSLEKTSDGITNDLWSMSSQFTEYGVSTSNLNNLHGWAKTLASLTPELFRRASVAEAITKREGGDIAFFTGDLIGDFKTIAAAKAQAKADVKKIKQAMKNGEDIPQSVKDDLKKYAKDPDYSKEFVKQLGPDGLQKFYSNLAHKMHSYRDLQGAWSWLKNFNDTVSNGISQQSSKEMDNFAKKFIEGSQGLGPRYWAMLCGSKYADGRMNAIAEVYANEINTPTSSFPGQFPVYKAALSLAYGNPVPNLYKYFSEHSSGKAMAQVIKGASGEYRDQLITRLLSTQESGSPGLYGMDKDDYQYKANLYGAALKFLADGGSENCDAVESMLKAFNGVPAPYRDTIVPSVNDALDDPSVLTWLLQKARFGQFDSGVLSDAFGAANVDIDKLVARMIDYEIAHHKDEHRLANDLGYLLGTKDILGEKVSLAGVIESLAGSAAGMNPATGAAYGVFQALAGEMGRIQQDKQDWDDAWSNERAQRLLSFMVYAHAHGGDVPGFDKWVRAHHRAKDPKAILAFYEDQEDKGTKVFRELDSLRDDIDEARDE